MPSEEEVPKFNGDEYLCQALSIVVYGASGDLAKKKTYPALFALYEHGFLPKATVIFGFSRSNISDSDFREHIKKFLKGDEEKVSGFLELCVYRSGQYDDPDRINEVAKELTEVESKAGAKASNRLFYFALPPNLFAVVGSAIKQGEAFSTKGWNRIIVEKPFGRDLQSSNELSEQLTGLFKEDQIYRIDHYLGKEMVQNLMVLRFGNRIFEPLWNNLNVKMVTITFKEDIGTGGRGGYFDSYGIIRDVIQNHLLQVLSLVAMEAPVKIAGENYANYVRDEKVKVLNCIPPVQLKDVIVGQYISDEAGKNPGYLDDKTVPRGSICPTFATIVMYINNARWHGVPFVLKAGKALNERKGEIRIQFQHPPALEFMFDGRELRRNELVIRLQPDEAIYLKTNVKKPGLATDAVVSELDLTYKERYDEAHSLPDAYTRLILDTLRGQQATFVRSDELTAAWKIFTPLLHELENKQVQPIPYRFGTRGPPESDELIADLGYEYHGGSYKWQRRGSSAKL